MIVLTPKLAARMGYFWGALAYRRPWRHTLLGYALTLPERPASTALPKHFPPRLRRHLRDMR